MSAIKDDRMILDGASYSLTDLYSLVGQKCVRRLWAVGLEPVAINDRGDERYFGDEVNRLMRLLPRKKKS